MEEKIYVVVKLDGESGTGEYWPALPEKGHVIIEGLMQYVVTGVEWRKPQGKNERVPTILAKSEYTGT